MLGTCLSMQSQYKKAINYFHRAVSGEPSNNNYRINLTEAYYWVGAFENALKTIRPVVKGDKAPPAALRWAGLLYRATGNNDTAKQILENAILVDKSCSDCYVALGDIYFEEMDYRNASKHLQIVVNTMEYDEVNSVKLAQSYYKLGKIDQARDIYQTITVKSPRNGEALYRLCNIHLKNNNIPEAKAILARNTSNKTGWYYLASGEIAEAEKNLKQAMADFAKALKMIPNVSEVQYAAEE